MHFFIRTDSSFSIGTGHLMRCLTLARQLKSQAHSISFACRPQRGSSHQSITQEFPVLELSSPALNQESDALECQEILKSLPRDTVIIVDHYSLDEVWERFFYSHHRIVVIDDLANRKHLCHVLIDTNYRNEKNTTPYLDLTPKYASVLLGPQNCLLRDEIISRSQNLPANRNKVLVFFGGTDPSNEAGRFLNALKSKESDLFYSLAITKTHTAYGDLRNGQLPKNCELIVDGEFAELMATHKLYFGSGGTVTWERMLLGLPGIVVAVAENQEAIANDLAHHQYQFYLGRAQDISYEQALEKIHEIYRNDSWLEQTAAKGRSLVAPIHLETFITSLELSVRPANESDAQFLYDLRNDPLTNAMSQTNSAFSYSSHVDWLEKKIASDNPVLIILSQGQRAGQIRIDPDMSVSIAVDPRFRGKGIAKQILKTVTFNYAKSLGREDVSFFATIKSDNPASIAIFESAGFQKETTFYENNSNFGRYRLTIMHR